jgi:branched-chain amino acid transport system ATP-binding protein
VTPPLFETRALAVRFGGVEALRGLSLEVAPLQLLDVGSNGAGKSTLLNVCTGYVRPDQGRLSFLGREITGFPPRAAARAGIGRTFQHPQVFGPYTVMDNLRFAVSAAGAFWCLRDLRGGRFDAEASAFARLFGLDAAAGQAAGTLLRARASFWTSPWRSRPPRRFCSWTNRQAASARRRSSTSWIA